MPKNTSNRPQAGGEHSRLESAAAELQAVTTHQAFFPATPKSDHLFAVQAGIPLNDALEQLTLLIGVAENSAMDVAICVGNGGEANGAWAPVHLLTFAHALTQSIHRGYVEAQRVARSQGE